MHAKLEKADRIVLEYLNEDASDEHKNIRFALVQMTDEDAGPDNYVVLWQYVEGNLDDLWTLQWKGNWRSSCDWFIDLIGDFEYERNFRESVGDDAHGDQIGSYAHALLESGPEAQAARQAEELLRRLP
jgi:hypothetical protein